MLEFFIIVFLFILHVIVVMFVCFVFVFFCCFFFLFSCLINVAYKTFARFFFLRLLKYTEGKKTRH